MHSSKKFNVQAHLELAHHYQSAGKYSDAIHELEMALSDDPANPAICYFYSKLLTLTKQYEKAKIELLKILNLNSNYVNAQNDLGEIYAIMGDQRKALMHFKEAVAIDNKHYCALNNFLNILIKAGDLQEAANIVEPILKNSPNDPNLLKIVKKFIAIAKKTKKIRVEATSSPETYREVSCIELKQKTAKYYQNIKQFYHLDSSVAIINKFVHPVWIKQLTTLGTMIIEGLPDNFLLHPICLEMFVRAGWRPQQEYELSYIVNLDEKLRNLIYSIKESPVGQITHDCHKLDISVNTLGMLWYFARINEKLIPAPGSIIEFGGGFGSLSRIFKTCSNKDMTYTIMDLPEMLALQYYFLSGSMGGDIVVPHISPDEKIIPGKINLFPVYGIEKINISSDLFISTFALSETPDITQNLVCIGKNFFNAPYVYITGQLIGERTELSWQTPNTIVMAALHLRSHIAMNRFHIGSNYELMALQKMVNIKSYAGSGKRNEFGDNPQKIQNRVPSAIDDGHAHKTLAIVFSKDRAMQLDCTIRSFMQHCKDVDTVALKVLYTTSNTSHENQYQKLKTEYPLVDFIREGNFKNDLLFMLSSTEYIFFLVDDNVFVNDFYMDVVIKGLIQHPDAIGFSLRLGKNTTYHYMIDKQQALPKFYSIENAVLCYDWTTAEYDFGYPLEVSSSVYRLADIFPLLNQGDFKNPNTLELFLDSNKAFYLNKKNKLLCYEHSIAFCNPLNIVQSMWANKAGKNSGYTPEKLSQLFEEGFRIDIEALSGFRPNSCHQEIEFEFVNYLDTITNYIEATPLVSILIISYNGIKHIKDCLESIKRNTPESHEIVVVDNARNDGSLDYLKTVPGAIVISNPSNIGYSPARAQAMSIAKGKYLISLNDNTIVTKGWVSKFIKHAENNPEVGIIGPRSNYVSGPQIVANVAYDNIDGLEAFAETWSSQNHDHLTQSNRLIGFCMFISKKVIDRIGSIDPNFGKLFGFDDDDYSLRAQIAGFNLAIADDIFIHHTGGPQGRGNKEYNELLLGAWEMFKEKWCLKKNRPYGSSYDIAEILSRKFDKTKHYSPLYESSIVEKYVCKSQFEYRTSQASAEITTTTKTGLTSVIIPIFDFNNNLRRCIESINKHTEEPCEILLVVKGFPTAPTWFKKYNNGNQYLTLINAPKDAGFSVMCNEALKKVTGQYILILDENSIMLKGALAKIRERLVQYPEYGITVPLSNNAIGVQQIPKTQKMSFKNFKEYAKTFSQRNRYRYIAAFEIDSICTLIKRELIDIIGLFNVQIETPFFVINDYRIRALLEGYQTMIAGDACIYQSQDSQRRKGSDKVFHEQWGIFNPHTETGKKLSPFVAMKNARDYFSKGLFDKSVQAIMEGIRYTPEEEELYYCLAEILLEGKSYQESIEAIKAMPKAGRGKARAMEILGYCNYYSGRLEKAEDYTDHAISLSGDTAKALNLKGLTALKRGDRKKAKDLFQQATSVNPCFADPYLNMGVMKWHNNEEKEALELIEKGFILSPETEDFSTTYHSAISSLKEFSRAEIVFMGACRLFPKNKKLSFLFIGILLQQEKYAEAMKEIENAMLAFGIDDEILSAAFAVREKIGPLAIDSTGKKTGTLSVCMIARNEEKYIARCLKSITPIADEIIVVDTGSTDRTRDIAKVFGAKLYDFPWTDDFSQSRNHSLSLAKGQWILVHDADEVISPRDYDDLKDIIGRKTPKPVAYTLTTRNYTNNPSLEGWTQNLGEYSEEEEGTGWFPGKKVRLFVNDKKIHFENSVHEVVEPSIFRAGIPIQVTSVPIHHFGKLDDKKTKEKAEHYYQLGFRKLNESNGNSTALRELAIQAGELEHYREAIDLWESYLETDTNSSLGYFNLSKCYLETGQFDKAFNAAKKAREIDPQSKEAELSYAVASMVQGRIMESITCLEKLAQTFNEYPPAMAALGAAYCITGNQSQGINQFRKIKKMGYNCATALHSLSKMLTQAGRSEYANLLLEKIEATGKL